MRNALILSILAAAALGAQQTPPAPPPFRVDETTIAGIHDALKSGRVTCRALVDMYLRRIQAYDKNGPALNAIVGINPDAQRQADDLDRRYAQSGPVGPLHCVPTIVKDNFETIGLQSAAGSLSLRGFISNKDAFQVKRIKEAGAIVLAKSNMAEFAFSPYETVNSLLPGYTRNPYALDRVTAGSSGGTAAAVAANFGAVGLGSDTGNSIRGPSSHQALVGIRSTMGLTSRAGVVPLSMLADIAGPMTRTVEDAVAVFQVIVGEDPDDPATAAAVAANFGAVGLGSDTGNSIRGPSSHQALVGIRSTMGLTSRAGVMPLNLLADIAGPMARTVEDAARVFQVVVGEDPADPATAASHGRQPENYLGALQRDGLRGARIGVLRQAYERDTTDPEIVQVFMGAVEDL